MKRTLFSFFLILFLAACAPSQPAPTVTTTGTQPPTSTLTRTSANTQSPTITQASISTEIALSQYPEFLELEGIKIYYSNEEGIRYIYFRCGNMDTECIENKEVINFDQITTFNEIVCISISPGLDQISFGSRNYSPSGSTDLFVYDFESGKTDRLTETPDYSECGAIWSPDGQRLAVKAHRYAGGHSFIYLTNPNGCCQQIIPNQGKFDRNPTWSPDGENIAFISGTGYESHLFVYNLKNWEEVALAPDMTFKSSTRMSWSPDGTKLAVLALFEDDTDICIVEIASNDYFCLNETEYTESLPSWSSDGSRLIYSAYDKEVETHDIYLINVDGTNKTQITTDGVFFDPVWLRNDGFFVSTDLNDAGRQIWISAIDGSWQQQLTFESGVNNIINITYP